LATNRLALILIKSRFEVPTGLLIACAITKIAIRVAGRAAGATTTDFVTVKHINSRGGQALGIALIETVAPSASQRVKHWGALLDIGPARPICRPTALRLAS
jgi:hypothetical protein